MELDLGFMKRVYRTSVAVLLFLLLICAALGNWRAAVGISVGSAISLVSLRLLEELVTRLFQPENSAQSRSAVRKVIAAAFVKYLVIGAVLWASLESGWASAAGLAIGIGLPQAVIFLKALGIWLTFGPDTNRRK